MVETLAFSNYKIMSLAKMDNLTSFFPIWMPSISFSCHIGLARTFALILNKCSENNVVLDKTFDCKPNFIYKVEKIVEEPKNVQI